MVARNHPGGGGGQWRETILFNQPGSRPEYTVEIAALTLAASEESPRVNPAFVINNWGDHPVSVRLNGQDLVVRV